MQRIKPILIYMALGLFWNQSARAEGCLALIKESAYKTLTLAEDTSTIANDVCKLGYVKVTKASSDSTVADTCVLVACGTKAKLCIKYDATTGFPVYYCASK